MNEIKTKLNEDLKRLYKYINEYNQTPQILEENIKIVKFSTGGEILNRGYFNPSPIIDLIIGNVNRGKLMTKVINDDKISFKYYFDDFDRLIYVESFSKELGNILYEKEYLYYRDNKVVGCKFFQDNKLSCISEFSFDGELPKKYIEIHFQYETTVWQLEKEEYIFQKGILKTAIIIDYLVNMNQDLIPKEKFLSVHKYNLNTDNAGYLSNYTFRDNNDVLENIDDRVYYLREKRKISEFINNVLYCYIGLGKNIAYSKNEIEEPYDIYRYIKYKIIEIIESWNLENGYAISVLIYGNSTITLDYNEENEDNSIIHSEKRWNYAFWNQHSYEVLNSDEEIQLLKNWLNSIDTKFNDDCSANDLINNHYFTDIIIKVINEVRKEGWVKKAFGKEVPIIIHNLEYYDHVINLTKRVNDKDLLLDFMLWYQKSLC